MDDAIKKIFQKCNTCFKQIQDSDTYIVAYKNECPAYFCREHIDDAKKYLDWFQEFVEVDEM